MSLKQIDQLLNPRSIAVIGASNLPNRPGNAVMRNLLQGNFAGPIMPVTPKYQAVNGVLAYRSIAALPEVPDLAVICTRAARVPALIQQLGKKGTRSVIVIAAGLDQLQTAQGTNLQEQMLAIARQWGVRLLGPNSLGLFVPGIGLNASYAHTHALPGKVAFVSQSSGVCVTILDWARRRQIGFSHFIALGDGADVDFDELIDYLGRDPKTRAILLYIDSIRDGRAFMSAARAASSGKPILVIKAGNSAEVSSATSRQPPERRGADLVYEAAFRRAGMLRVHDLRDLFAAVETLAYGRELRGEQLLVLGNGNGPAAMAADALVQRGGHLAPLREEVQGQLRPLIPSGGRAANPVNLLGDATPELYRETLQVLLDSGKPDNILVMHAPSALHPGEVYAEAVIDVWQNKRGRKPNLLVNWMGEEAAYNARQRFAEAGIASFRTPEGAVAAFMHRVQYRRNQKLLSETPDSVSELIPHHPERARELIRQALEAEECALGEAEGAELVQAYGIHTLAEKESDRYGDALSLRIQVRPDPVFGPVIALGEAGSVWEWQRNAVVALPPLNMALARYLVIQALAEGKIRERHQSIERHSLCLLLSQVSQLVVDNPELAELDLNPVAMRSGVYTALEVSVRLAPAAQALPLAIRPYPKELEQRVELKGGRSVLLRPIRPEDEARQQAFDRALSKEDRYNRYFGEVSEFSHEQMARVTQIDYDREMAFIATERDERGDEVTLGVVQAQMDPDNQEAEFGIAIRSDLKGKGLGWLLMNKMIDYCRHSGTRYLAGCTMPQNRGMANLARSLGFRVRYNAEEEVIDMRLEL
ncbi:bifunctional acetate--CoA ligase family protein/GNAT family N-acetyltransferase [Marinimicrobium locisalis]|uniref:bifunctional acetate--CoA ligase family protein/GNAT family N-acetyltransferase n=1 Tax=Marinimicrobium locisalis TaxID=546022 RepID=UPI0032214CFB